MQRRSGGPCERCGRAARSGWSRSGRGGHRAGSDDCRDEDWSGGVDLGRLREAALGRHEGNGHRSLHWDADEWRNFGLITGGLAISVAFLDKPIRDAAQRSRSSSADDFFRNVEKFGTKQYGLPVLFGFYAVGLAVDDYNAKTVALDGFSASVISSLTTSVFKGIAGRARPNSGLGPHHWNPFGGDQSFPSGHATGAFAFAAVIAGHYDSPWVATTAYTIASLVGVARIEQDAHWASDVVAGGLIGGLIGHHLVQFNETWRENHELAPEIGTDGRQL